MYERNKVVKQKLWLFDMIVIILIHRDENACLFVEANDVHSL